MMRTFCGIALSRFGGKPGQAVIERLPRRQAI